MAHCRLHRATLFRDGIKRFDELARWVRPSHSLGSHTTVVRDQIKQFDHLAPARNICTFSNSATSATHRKRNAAPPNHAVVTFTPGAVTLTEPGVQDAKYFSPGKLAGVRRSFTSW